MLYFSPLLLIALSPLTVGINFNGGVALILANMFFNAWYRYSGGNFLFGNHLRSVAGYFTMP